MIKKKLVFEKEYLSIRKKPINLDEGDKYLFHHEFKKMIKNSYGFYISNIYIKKYKLYKFKKICYFNKIYKYD